MHACEKFNEINFDTQTHSLEILDDFIREEQSDCESFSEAMKEIKRIGLQRGEIKQRLDRQLEGVGLMMDSQSKGEETASGGLNLKKAKADLDQLEKDFRDVDMLYNIMIINMAHVEIDRYKIERQYKYNRMLNDYA